MCSLEHEPQTGPLPEAPFGYEEFARRTGMSADWAKRHIGRLPHHRPTPGRVRFTQQDVDDYLASVRHVPADPFIRAAAARARRQGQ